MFYGDPSKLRRSSLKNRLSRSGFTFTELLVAVALAAILTGMLLPTLKTAEETQKAAVCLANMHQWGLAISMYSEDWNDYIPPEGAGTPASGSPYAWYNVLSPYVGAPSLITLYAEGRPPTPSSKSVYSCPSTTNCPANPTDASPFYMYGMNNRMDPNGPALFKRAQCVQPSNTVMFCENDGSFSQSNGKYCPPRHNGGANLTFVDGHAEWIKWEDYCRQCPANPADPDDSSALSGDWKAGRKYHWFPYKNAPT
jgi:prepilin-type processing-associated H-X9-DG protein/prepilin-type N-terminal cleavage/methylation domain-containing protein